MPMKDVPLANPLQILMPLSKKIAEMTVRTFATDSMIYRTIGLLQTEIDLLDKSSKDYYSKNGRSHGKICYRDFHGKSLWY